MLSCTVLAYIISVDYTDMIQMLTDIQSRTEMLLNGVGLLSVVYCHLSGHGKFSS